MQVDQFLESVRLVQHGTVTICLHHYFACQAAARERLRRLDVIAHINLGSSVLGFKLEYIKRWLQ